MIVDPVLDLVGCLGELGPELPRLLFQRRRHPRAEASEYAEESNDDQYGANTARNPYSLEPVDRGCDRESEEDTEEDDEEQFVSDPEQP